jgi:hypothetical protein
MERRNDQLLAAARQPAGRRRLFASHTPVIRQMADSPADILAVTEHADYDLAVPTPDHFIPYGLGVEASALLARCGSRRFTKRRASRPNKHVSFIRHSTNVRYGRKTDISAMAERAVSHRKQSSGSYCLFRQEGIISPQERPSASSMYPALWVAPANPSVRVGS